MPKKRRPHSSLTRRGCQRWADRMLRALYLESDAPRPPDVWFSADALLDSRARSRRAAFAVLAASEAPDTFRAEGTVENR